MIEHVDGVMGASGLQGALVAAEECPGLMHRSCSWGLPSLRNQSAAPGAIWEPKGLADCCEIQGFEIQGTAGANE